MHGTFTFREAEERAQYLLDLGRAVDPAKWVTGLIRRGQREANGAVMAGLI